MRLVLDANTVISGLLWGGTPGKLIDAARADLVVSGDSDLLQLKSYHGIPIVSATQAVERLNR
jgi:predicted nucleic acid-binding protein